MLKKLLVGFAMLSAVGAGAALYVTRDFGPTHPTLKASNLPSLIPARVFYAAPNSKWDYVASGDGALLAYRKSTVMGHSLAVAEVDGKELATFPVDAQFVRWHPTKPLLRFIFQGHDWEVDPLKPERAEWRRTSPVKLSGGWVKNETARDAEMRIMTWGKVSTRAPGHMWLVSQDGLEAEMIAEGTQDSIFWVFNDEMEPILRKDTLDPATERLFVNTPDGWEKLID